MEPEDWIFAKLKFCSCLTITIRMFWIKSRTVEKKEKRKRKKKGKERKKEKKEKRKRKKSKNKKQTNKQTNKGQKLNYFINQL